MDGLECHIVNHLQDVLQFLKGQVSFPVQQSTIESAAAIISHPKDFAHIIGHEHAKFALEVAASGGHHVLVSGPPGCGKSLLAETFPSILPPLTKKEQLEVISLYQLAQEKLELPHSPPYRHPHHSASAVSIIGGGSNPKPGEISLAHHGTLFLDEMAEFTKKTLDMLRQPLETGKVTISRVYSTVTYPSSFILIGAMNPCPCGYFGSNTHYCTCTPKQIQSYSNRVSGPIYDRMDILLSLKSVNLDQSIEQNESSFDMRERVRKAREIQYDRYQAEVCNADIAYEQLLAVSPLTESQKMMLTQISSKQQWSNRVQVKMLRLARTISDLEGSDSFTDESIWKAMTLRRALDDNRFGKRGMANGTT